MRKHGPENIQMDILETYHNVQVSTLKARETVMIDDYRSSGFDLTNTTDGGEGISGFKHREESKRNMSLNRSGEKNVWYGVKGEAHPLHGRKASDEARSNMSIAQTGRVNSPEARKKISEKAKGRDPWNKGVATGQEPWNKGMKTGAKHTKPRTFSQGNHTRHHTMKNIVNPLCPLCTVEP